MFHGMVNEDFTGWAGELKNYEVNDGAIACKPGLGGNIFTQEEYGDFVAHTVVPAIDRRFRTMPERGCRGIGGASLGAISALQIGLAHPDRFASDPSRLAPARALASAPRLRPGARSHPIVSDSSTAAVHPGGTAIVVSRW